MKATRRNKQGKLEKHQKIMDGECIFPFKYKWKTHDACYNTNKGDICATSINPKTRTLRKYGYCVDTSRTSKHHKTIKLHKPKLHKPIKLKRKLKTKLRQLNCTISQIF